MRTLHKHKSPQSPISFLFFFHVLKYIYLEIGVVENLVLDLSEDNEEDEVILEYPVDLIEPQALS